MSVGSESRWNLARRVRVIDISGNLTENERLELPIPRVPIVKTDRANFVEYQVIDGDTWSNIAARHLNGRSDLWWIIAEASGVVDPFKGLYVGAVLRIPPFSEVMFNILSFDRTVVGDPNFPDEVIVPPPYVIT